MEGLLRHAAEGHAQDLQGADPKTKILNRNRNPPKNVKSLSPPNSKLKSLECSVKLDNLSDLKSETEILTMFRLNRSKKMMILCQIANQILRLNWIIT